MRFRIVFGNGFEARTKAFTPKRQRVKSEPVLRTFVFRSGKERLCFLGSWGERDFERGVRVRFPHLPDSALSISRQDLLLIKIFTIPLSIRNGTEVVRTKSQPK